MSKRPFQTQDPSNIIDLTSDNEDAQPPKRQRSEFSVPRTNTQTTPIINDLDKKTPTTSVNQSIATTAATPFTKHVVRDSNGKFSVKSVPPKPFTTKSAPTRDKGILADNGARTSTVKIPHPKHGVTNSMKSLTISQSPASQHRSISHKSSAADLETDSDRASKDNDGSRTSSIASTSRVAHVLEVSSKKFLIRDQQAIKPDLTVVSPPRETLTQTHIVSRNQHHPTQPRPLEQSSYTTKLSSPPKPVRVVLPPNPKEKASRQKEIVEKIKQDPTYIDQNSEEVFSVIGVKLFNNKDLTKEHSDKARQRKHQPPVDRTKVLLDFGESPRPSTPATNKITLVHPRKQTRSILNERFEHKDHTSLTFENHINDRRINGKFQFISNYIFSRGIQKAKQTPHSHHNCSCENGICGTECSCLITQLVAKVDDIAHDSNVRTYQRHPQHNNLIVLSDALIEDTTHTARIFECGDFCPCSERCLDRVVQKGRTVPLEIFETGKYGFGVRSSQDIFRGQFIDIYLGEVLTSVELGKREAAAEEDTPSYIMSLDAFTNDEKNIFYVDGENFGSVTRFVNHSCEPNCKTIPVVLPKGTKQLYYVAFFAMKDIPKGTEITIDYDPDLPVEEGVVDDIVQCQCGSAKCRKRLWAPGKEKRQRKKRYLPSKDDD